MENKQKRNKWTVMVYLGGDNNLAEEMVYALKCMQLVGSDPHRYEVFALYDGGVGPTTLRIEKRSQFPPTGVQGSEGFLATAEQDRVPEEVKMRMRTAKAELESAKENREKGEQSLRTAQIVEDLQKAERIEIVKARFERAEEEADAAKAILPESVTSVQSALTKFVINTIEEAPAESYMLVLSGHGSGAVGDFLTGKNTGLSIPDLREALTVIQEKFLDKTYEDQNEDGETQSYSYLKDGKIDILGLDSCVMGMAEVAYEVRECVKYLVGAEGFEPNTGWPFDRILNFLREKLSEPEELKAKEFARRIVEEYISYYSSDYTLADVSTHLCALDLDKIERLASGLGRTEGLFSPLKMEVEADLADPETQGAIKKAFLDYVDNPETQKAIFDELQRNDLDLGTNAVSTFQDPMIQLAISQVAEDLPIVMSQVAEELPTDLFVEALADSQVQEAIEGFRPSDRLSELLNDALKDAETQAAIQEFKSDYGLSELLRRALTTVGSREDIRKGFEGFDDVFEGFKKDLLSDETTTAIKQALGGRDVFWNVLDKTLRTSAIGSSILDALEWDEGLSGILRQALQDSATRDSIKDVILLAHWEAQGYKSEQHADLWDFCDRLREGCLKTQSIHQKIPEPNSIKIADTCRRAAEACTKVIGIIDGKGGKSGLVFASASCGPAFQHSHGISIFFPWANITDASGFREVEHYRSLEFTHQTQWDEFLIAYHQATQRPSRSGSLPVHPSKLNRRDDLFTARPTEFLTPLAVELGTELTARLAAALGSAFCRRIGAELNTPLEALLNRRLETSLNARLGTSLNARLGTSLSARLGTSLNARLGTSLSARLGTSLSARLGTSLSARLGTSLSARLGTSLSARLGTSLSARLGTSLNARLGTSLNARLGTSLSARLGTSLNARLGTSLSARLGTSLSARLGTSLSARLGTSLSARFGTGGGGTPKIESMKNPPIVWREGRKQKEPTEASERWRTAAGRQTA